LLSSIIFCMKIALVYWSCAICDILPSRVVCQNNSGQEMADSIVFFW
jgi:hypothetical protein